MFEIHKIYSRNNKELISTGVTSLNIDITLLDKAEIELLNRRQERKDEGFVWGYLLGVELENIKDFPCSIELVKTLRNHLLHLNISSDFAFSFCKVCRGQSTADAEGVHYEGMHLDTHPLLNEKNELLRILFNLSKYPRRFQFALTDRHELEDLKIELDRTNYKTLKLPDSIASNIIEIPGRQNNTVHFLKFWASAVPHVGLTDGNGYFLTSFETLQ